MAQLISKQFHAALCHLLEKEGRGAQSRLAAQQKIDKGYLNGIIKGRKPGSEAVRGRIATYFKTTYEDMLILGRQLLDVTETEGGEEPKITEEPQSEERLSVVSLSTQKNITEENALRIKELIKKTAEILESDNQSSQALAQMIDTFHNSIIKEKKNQEQKKELNEMKERLKTLEELIVSDKKGHRKSA